MTPLAHEYFTRNAADAARYLVRINARIREPILANYSGELRLELAAEAAAPDPAPALGNVRLATLHRQLKAAHVLRAFDEQAIRDHAENYARQCELMPMLAQREAFALYLGIEPPPAKFMTDRYEGRALRLADPRWWRRQLRKVWTRAAENTFRDLGRIRKGRAPYASNEAVRQRGNQKRRMREFLESHEAVNEAGEQIPLIEAAAKSTANPAIRRGEFMCRARGFEETARSLGHVAEFVTLTAPSFFHAQLAAGGRNPAFERAMVRDAQAWLCKMWARARARLKRLSVLVYGFRIAEPHHDATPHWHLLLFLRAADADTLRTVLREIWLSEMPAEAGAREHRAKFERIEAGRGSATGYVAKYVSKNIDGAGAIGNERDNETDSNIIDGIRRVDAWASVHGIRQFQQIGGPPVTLWREARRLHDRVADPDIERARLCADRGSFSGFTQRVGGIHVGRRTNLVLERCETGACNTYGEPRPAAIIGLRYASAVVITRPHCWRIARRGACSGSSPRSFSHLGPVAITVRGAAGINEPAAWSNPLETSQAGPN